MELTALPITEQARTLLATSIANYQRHARLRLSVDTHKPKCAWITAHQYEPAPGGRVLTDDEILERATEAFAPLKAEGIEPIICVYTLADGDPHKPVTKHRANNNVVVRNNIRSVIIRIAPPRVAFTMDKGELFLLDAEEHASLHFWDSLKAQATAEQEELVKAEKYKAEQWAKRAPHREGLNISTTSKKVQHFVEEVSENNADIDLAMRSAGIDTGKGLIDQGITVLNSGTLADAVRKYVKHGKVLLTLHRNTRGVWEVAASTAEAEGVE